MKSRDLIVAGAFALAVADAGLGARAKQRRCQRKSKVDLSAGKITIKHGPLKKFDMDEGMTMVFRAAEPESPEELQAWRQDLFVPERVNGQFTAAKIEKAK